MKNPLQSSGKTKDSTARAHRNAPLRPGVSHHGIEKKSEVLPAMDELKEDAAEIGNHARQLVKNYGVRLNEISEKLDNMTKDEQKRDKELLRVTQNMVYSVFEVVRKHHEEISLHLLTLLDKVSGLQSGVAYLQKQKRAPAERGEGAAAAPAEKNDSLNFQRKFEEAESKKRLLEEEVSSLKKKLEALQGGDKRHVRGSLFGSRKKRKDS